MLIILIARAGLFREGVARLVCDFEPGTEVRCADYRTSSFEAGTNADLLIVDGDSQSEALDALSALRHIFPHVPALALLTDIDQPTIGLFMVAGVARCFSKSQSAQALRDALHEMLAAATHLPPTFPTIAHTLAMPGASEETRATTEPAINSRMLTPRQIEVLALVARGESNKSIARQLNIAEGTVKVHLYTVYKALNVESRRQASIAAARLDKVGDAQLHQALDAQLAIKRLLSDLPPRRFKRGDVLFRKDAPSDALYYVLRGTVTLQEIGVDVGAGTLVGEIGLFSPDHRRTCTAFCRSDCELLMVSATEAMRMYYQDPEFAIYLIHLVTRRLEADKLRSKQESAGRSRV
jgi:two-component system, NarL family, nitrate/nitrite response regulator NarL